MNIEKLPDSLSEVYHRARDIMFSDKTQRQIRMSKVITRYLKYIEELYQIIDKNIDPAKIDKKQLEKIRHTSSYATCNFYDIFQISLLAFLVLVYG